VRHPYDPVDQSYCPGGVIEEEPETVVSLAVSDKKDDPVAILERWTSEAWIYAEIDSLEPLNR